MSPRKIASVPARIPRDFQQSYKSRLQVWKQIAFPCFSLTFVLVLLRLLGLMQSLELKGFDLLLRYQPFDPPSPHITLVGITQEDISLLEQYPVSDTKLSQVLRSLDQAGARVIGLNLFRDIPVQPGYDEILQTFQDLDNLVSIELIRPDGTPTIASPPHVPEDRIGFANVKEDRDWHLRRALLSGTMPLAKTQAGEGEEGQGEARKNQRGQNKAGRRRKEISEKSPEKNPEKNPEPSEVKYKYAFGVRLAQQYLAPLGYQLKTQSSKDLVFTAPEGDREVSIHTFYPRMGGYVWDKISGRSMMMRFRQGRNAFPVITLTEILNNQFDKSLVRDRIVIMGNIASGSKDVFLAPGLRHSIWSQSENYQGSIPFLYGLEIHAQVASQLVGTVLGERSEIWALPSFLEYSLIVVAGMLGTGVGIFLASPLGRLCGLAVLGTGMTLVAYAALYLGLWLPLLPCVIAFAGVGFTTLFIDRELWLRYEQANATLEYAYNAVHNGPLQSLVLILRKVSEQSELHEHLFELNSELRAIYESLRNELNRSGQQFTLGQSQLNADEPLLLLLDQTYNITLSREFPGFESIVVFMSPQLEAFKDVFMSSLHKQQVCYFLEEALCNVGKHAERASRLDVLGVRDRQWLYLRIIDNGQVSAEPSVAGHDCYADSSSQGTKQMEAIAESIGGKFCRTQHHPQGTMCQLGWPVKPPLVRETMRLFSKF